MAAALITQPLTKSHSRVTQPLRVAGGSSRNLSDCSPPAALLLHCAPHSWVPTTPHHHHNCILPLPLVSSCFSTRIFLRNQLGRMKRGSYCFLASVPSNDCSKPFSDKPASQLGRESVPKAEELLRWWIEEEERGRRQGVMWDRSI